MTTLHYMEVVCVRINFSGNTGTLFYSVSHCGAPGLPSGKLVHGGRYGECSLASPQPSLVMEVPGSPGLDIARRGFVKLIKVVSVHLTACNVWY